LRKDNEKKSGEERVRDKEEERPRGGDGR